MLAQKPGRIMTVVLATRPWSFSMTVLSVLIGSIVVTSDRGFFWLGFVLTVLGAVLTHAAANVLNDVLDFRHGVDKPGAPTTVYRRHPLVEGDMSRRAVLILAIVLYLGAIACGAVLTAIRGVVVVYLALAGLLASVFYTADPIRYKHRALGEVAVFLMWGPLMVGGAYYVQHGSWAGAVPALAISLPQGLWVALVILANNLTDIGFDGEASIRTVGTELGRKRATRLFAAMAVAAFALTLTLAAFAVIPRWCLLVALSAPSSIKLVRVLALGDSVPADADPRTARVGMLFGIAMVAGLLLHRVLPW